MASRASLAAALLSGSVVVVGCSAPVVSQGPLPSKGDKDATAMGANPPLPEAAPSASDGDALDLDAANDASDEGAGDDATVDASGDRGAAETSVEAGDADAFSDGAPSFDDASDDAGAPVPRGPTWANWPMPNPASSGLPNPASYDTSTPGIVLDNVTGLMWDAADHDGYDSVQAAAAYCTALRLGGFADWRLPSRIEVWSIQDFTHFNPALDSVFSTVGTESDRPAPWTSTPGGNVYTSQGFQSVESIAGFESAPYTTARCVRGSTAQPDPHYTVSGGTVFDHGTGLTWEQDYDAIPSLPNGVANYCASLALAGGGWRAPSVKELESIVDDLLVEPELDGTVFHYPSSGAGNVVFWSSSPWAATPQLGESVYVDFDDGSNGTGDNTIPTPPYGGNNNFYQVRCVK
jgi:hypothetical protein